MTNFFVPKHLSEESRKIVIRLHEKIQELHNSYLFDTEENNWNELKDMNGE